MTLLSLLVFALGVGGVLVASASRSRPPTSLSAPPCNAVTECDDCRKEIIGRGETFERAVANAEIGHFLLTGCRGSVQATAASAGEADRKAAAETEAAAIKERDQNAVNAGFLTTDEAIQKIKEISAAGMTAAECSDAFARCRSMLNSDFVRERAGLPPLPPRPAPTSAPGPGIVVRS